MVKLLTSLFAATLVALASAAPFDQMPFNFFDHNNCIPQVDTKVNEVFNLKNVGLQSLISRVSTSDLIIAGIVGDKSFEQIDFCFVSAEGDCSFESDNDHSLSSSSSSQSGECIRENVDYRIKVNAPDQGYLRVERGYILVVPSFKLSTPLRLHKNEEGGLSIAQLLPNGELQVFTTRVAGTPVVMRYEEPDNVKQAFELERPKRHTQALTANQCVPEVNIKEYRPFLLKSSNLNTMVSKQVQSDLIVGGPKSANKNYKQLELCVVSSDYGCSTEIKSNCIYQDIPYRIRVNSPVEGYLRITAQNTVEIVHNFADASRLNLYKEKGWGLRIAHLKDDGSRIVFSATREGYPIVLEKAISNAARQWFTLIEAN